MSDEIAKALNDLSQRFGIAVDWTSSNMLPYLQMLTKKYMNYRLIMSIENLIVGVLLLVISVILTKAAKRCYNKFKSGEADFFDEEICFHVGIASGIIAIVVFAFSCCVIRAGLKDIITCIIFPEKLILDELLQTLKS